jgi:hypothetical protein
MKLRGFALRALLLVVLLHACRSQKAPAPDPSAAGPEPDRTQAVVPGGGVGAGGRPLDLVDGYEVSQEEVRRVTHLTRAVLIVPMSANDAMATLFSETGIRFARLEGDERFGQYSCRGIDEETVRPWLDLAARELALHSPALIRHSGTRWVVFCRDVEQGGQKRGAVPAGSGGTLLLDTEGFVSEDFLRVTLHHELFHMIDFADGRYRADAEWAGLNPPGARYGRGAGARDASAPSVPGTGPDGAGAASRTRPSLPLTWHRDRRFAQRDPVTPQAISCCAPALLRRRKLARRLP